MGFYQLTQRNARRSSTASAYLAPTREIFDQALAQGIDASRVRTALDEFEKNLPADYKLAAAEAVNGTKARQLRNQYLRKIMLESMG